MNDYNHIVLCVDDEANILNSLMRLLRKEGYRLLTASTGGEALQILEENSVHVVISDQRMSQMNGIEFLSKVREKYPDTIRMILTGYTDVDTIMESVNKGHIYKFLLKPWNDLDLILNIRQALEQYELIQSNNTLHQRVMEQNEELKRMNDNLERRVKERTRDLEIQNQVLELSRVILDDLPIPVIGLSAEGMIVLINRHAQSLSNNFHHIEIGKEFRDYFSTDAEQKMAAALTSNTPQTLKNYQLSDKTYDIDIIPLSGIFRDKGVVLTVKQIGN